MGYIFDKVFSAVHTFCLSFMPHPYQMNGKKRSTKTPKPKTKAESAPTLADAIDNETVAALQDIQAELVKKPPVKAPPKAKPKKHKSTTTPQGKSANVPMHKRNLNLPKALPRTPSAEEQALLNAVLMDVDRDGFAPIVSQHVTVPAASQYIAAPHITATSKPVGIPHSLAPIPTIAKPPKLRPIRKKPVTLAEGGIDARQLDRFRKGQTEIEATLDLHGMSQSGAEANLISFFEEMLARQKRCLLVIPGKGQGILRQYVWQWLHESTYAEHILAVSTAKPYHGGEGAFYVLLRRRGV